MIASTRAWVAALLFSFSTSVYALDRESALQLFRNLHEPRSIVLTQDLIHQAQLTFARENPVALDEAAGEFLQGLATAEAVCEPQILSQLQYVLMRRGLPASAPATRDFLLLMRFKNQLDDVILFPLWKVSGVWRDLGFPKGELVQKIETSPHLGRDRLSRYFERLSEHCPTLAWKEYLSRKSATEKKAYSRETVIQDLDEGSRRRLLSPFLMAWFIGLERDRADDAPYLLDSILTNYKIAKNFHFNLRPIGAPRGGEGGAAREMSPLTSEISKRSSYSRRMGLYARYNYDQITALSELLILHFQIAFAPKAALVYSDESGNTIYSHPLEGQDVYNSAAMVLRDLIISTELDDPTTQASSNLMKFPFQDLVLAGLETGAIDGSYASEALMIDDLWNPPRSTREKVSIWVKRMLIPAALLVPPPYNLAPSLIMTFMDRLLKPKERALPVFPGSQR